MPHSRRAAQASNGDMHLSFEPAPDYGGIAKAAAAGGGGLFTGKASTVDGLKCVLDGAVEAVKGGRGAVVEVVLKEGSEG